MEKIAWKKRVGGTAHIRTWSDKGPTDQHLQQIIVTDDNGYLTFALPIPAIEGNRERVKAIFDSINEQTTYDELKLLQQLQVSAEYGTY